MAARSPPSTRTRRTPARGAAPRRQRGRRGGRGRRHARRDRAVLAGHRRRRLLRLLRRAHRQVSHDRRPRDRAGGDAPTTRSSTRRPASRYAVQPRPATSGLSVGVPGTLATWHRRCAAGARCSLARRAAPGDRRRPARLRRRPDVPRPDQRQPRPRSRQFSSTAALYLPGGQPPAVGSTFRNPDLAATYRLIARAGHRRASTAARSAATIVADRAAPAASRRDAHRGVRDPPGRHDVGRPAPRYTARRRAPTHVDYRGLDVYGMAPPSSGGSTVGEALNILERSDLGGADRATQALHRYLEASALAFADRNRYVGDPHYVDVPLDELLSPTASPPSGACLIDPTRALTKPVAPGRPATALRRRCATAAARRRRPTHGTSTTHLTVADRWGNVVEYTLTIEQIGGSAHGRARPRLPAQQRADRLQLHATQRRPPDPNLPAPGKRPRSSMAPTIVLARRPAVPRRRLARRLDDHHHRAADPGQPDRPRDDAAGGDRRAAGHPAQQHRDGGRAGVHRRVRKAAHRPLGHAFAPIAEIGAATGVEFLPDGKLLAAAEPVRRGGGGAEVVHPLATERQPRAEAGKPPGVARSTRRPARVALALAASAAAPPRRPKSRLASSR